FKLLRALYHGSLTRLLPTPSLDAEGTRCDRSPARKRVPGRRSAFPSGFQAGVPCGGFLWCAEGETRTLTGVRPRRPEHRVSANSTTSAGVATHRAALEGLLFT